MKRTLIIIILLLIIVVGGVMQFNSSKQEPVVAAKQIINEEKLVSYHTDVIITKFRGMAELNVSSVQLNFKEVKEREDFSSIRWVNGWFEKKAILHVTGELKLGVNLNQIQLFEKEDKIFVFVDKEDTTKTFEFDYDETFTENSSGGLAKNYPAEIVDELYKDAEETAKTEEFTKEVEEQFKQALKEELTNIIQTITKEKEVEVIFN